jgi:hypothetical protein
LSKNQSFNQKCFYLKISIFSKIKILSKFEKFSQKFEPYCKGFKIKPKTAKKPEKAPKVQT